MLHFFWNFSTFLLAMGMLITVHELGHFLVARCCKVTVECFSIGFGKAIFRWRDRLGTEYIIAAIPLGGYVKMLDEQTSNILPENRYRAFNQKSICQRAAIIAAGPIFNCLFATLLYWIIFLIGIPISQPVINTSMANKYENLSPISLKPVKHVKDFNIHDSQIDKKAYNNDESLVSILQELKNHLVISEIQPHSAAMKSGLQVGDTIIAVNDIKMTSWEKFICIIRDNPGRILKIGILRKNELFNITLQPDSKLVGKDKMEGFIGILPSISFSPLDLKTIQQYSPIEAFHLAVKKTCYIIYLTINMLSKLITGHVNLNNLNGPISIAKHAGISADYGIICYLMFLALMSINLGVVNLFPLPVLDGGHLIFLILEKLKGKAISTRMQNFSYRIGSIVLILLMGLAIFNDICKL
ncbi:RIP metalloprotease RseP [secondary endosymbiont of Heteropsylla cubana]|uniref:Zinc metalloprotease n=1 Tax=secondary endosymbiont of Heteropsylla cubana TaxID=134287 RepID=J3TGY2_9ENTR|nr:RIP metalloprotease RseP [secondary endosymbiont of Heteropsylla cubana]AFP85792.1 RIP metalloprotease RseP [secondary endosymbiont of Heteropsylla cubana]